MAELATIARPYAEALFRAATDVGGSVGAQDVYVWLDELSAISQTSEIRQVADDPRVTADQLLSVFIDVARTALPDMGKNFLRVIIENKRIDVIGEVAIQFRLLMNREGGSSDALVYSAFPLNSAALTDISELLEKRFGRKLNLSVQLDESLIGGIRVVVGDEVLDTSVKARLEQMKVALTA